MSKVEFADGVLRFAIPPQWESGDQDLRVEGTLRNDTLRGTMVDPGGNRLGWTAQRAPTLRRAAPTRWASPITCSTAALCRGGNARPTTGGWPTAF